MSAIKAPAKQEVKKEENPLKAVAPTEEKPELLNENLEVLPLEDRLLKLSILFEKQKQYNQLQLTLKNLDEFLLDKDDKQKICLSDGYRREFTTSNPDVFKEVVNVIKETVKKKLKELEPMLNW